MRWLIHLIIERSAYQNDEQPPSKLSSSCRQQEQVVGKGDKMKLWDGAGMTCEDDKMHVEMRRKILGPLAHPNSDGWAIFSLRQEDQVAGRELLQGAVEGAVRVKNNSKLCVIICR